MKNTTLLTASVFGYNVQDKVIFFRSTYRSGKDKNQQFTMAVTRPDTNVENTPARIMQANALIAELDNRADQKTPVRVVLEGSLADVTASQGKGDNSDKIYGDLTVFANEITPAFFGTNVPEAPASS